MNYRKADSTHELTLAEFAKQWSHAWKLFCRARSAAVSVSGPTDSLPARVRKLIDARAEAEHGPVLERLVQSEALARKVLVLRELDSIPQNANALLREHAISTVRGDLRAKIQRRYYDKVKKLAAFFRAKLLAVQSASATVSARNYQGSIETLRRIDLEEATLDFDGNTVISGQLRWRAVSITLPRTTDAPPLGDGKNKDVSVHFSPAKLKQAFEAWSANQRKAGALITEGRAVEAMKKELGCDIPRESLRKLIRALPDSNRAPRHRPSGTSN